MTIKTTSQTAISVELTGGSSTQVYTQFGMRYPDGTIRWGYDHEQYGGSICFEDLDDGTVQLAWRRRLEMRAEAANIQVSEYFEGHELIKRTVIVAVTEAEEL